MNQASMNLEGLNQAIGELLARTTNPEPPLREIGMLAISEMQQNIEEQGRPSKWTPSKAALARGGKTLRDSGTLLNSIGPSLHVAGNTVSVGPTAVSKKNLTDPRIMAILAFGGDAGRHHASHIRGWDYTYISPDAQQTMREIAQSYFLGDR